MDRKIHRRQEIFVAVMEAMLRAKRLSFICTLAKK
jgi:hypothetical protein